MADFETNVYRGSARPTDMSVDQGLRSYMLGIYNMMVLGLAVTGAAAFAIFTTAFTTDPAGAAAAINSKYFLTEFGYTLFASPLKWVVFLAPLAIVFGMSFGINRLSASTAGGLFFLYAALVGLSLSPIFAIYVAADIVRVFFITAAAFGLLSLYGYTTKQDISGWGSFLLMGLFGLIIAMIVNWFLASPALDFAISAIGVLVFAGLTAFDTQRLKLMYWEVGGNREAAAKVSVMGALSLYINFVAMFQFLLSLLGNREE